MPGSYHAHGVVLRTWKLGEADRIVVFLTRERGKVRGVAKGIRRTRSRFGARLEPLSHARLQLYEGRSELHTVTGADTIDHFRAIREDLDRLTKGVAMLEAIDQIGIEGEPSPRLYEMLVRALRTLAARNSELVTPGFFLKLLLAEGAGPHVADCVLCGEGGTDPSLLVSFSDADGGLVCRTHRRGLPVSADAVVLLQAALGGRLGDALSAPPSVATNEVGQVATRALEHFLERRLRTTTTLS